MVRYSDPLGIRHGHTIYMSEIGLAFVTPILLKYSKPMNDR